MVADADSIHAEFIAELASLQSPRGRVLSWRMRRFLPKPWESFEQLERLRHADVAWLSPHQVVLELAKLSDALASVDHVVDVPPWVCRRRDVLRQRLRLSGRTA